MGSVNPRPFRDSSRHEPVHQCSSEEEELLLSLVTSVAYFGGDVRSLPFKAEIGHQLISLSIESLERMKEIRR
jgi:hypothetical protein